VLIDFALPAEREAHDPPEARGIARDGVRMLVSRGSSGEIGHYGFRDLPGLLLPGDLLVVNNTGTLPAQVRASGELAVHFSTPLPDGAWLVELRQIKDTTSFPNGHGYPGQAICLPSGAVLTLERKATREAPGGRGPAAAGGKAGRVIPPGAGREASGGRGGVVPPGASTARLWRARLSVAVVPYLLRHGIPIRYSYVRRDWPLSAYQTVFARLPGSAEMPSASRPFTGSVVAALAARGVLIAPLTLHTGVSSLEADEDPYPEPYDVPPATARLVNHVQANGGRVIAAGTTVVRALETAAGAGGQVKPSAGWTSHVVTPQTGVRAVDGLLTGLHEPRSSHLRMLAAFAGAELLGRCYEAAVGSGYLWHEFGDVHLLLP
jgi:S-adenosylmethionine:tRNA ribosyltransferase-isomerase